MEIITTFDYGQLDTETRIVVRQRTLEIRAQIRHTAHAVADIGEKLIDVRSKLVGGSFDTWLKAEFGWTKMTAYRFIRVAEQFGSNNLLLDNAAPSALYILSDPSTSESIRQEFIEKAEAGQPVKHKDVKSRKAIGGIPKTTIEPLVADTASVSYGKDKSTRYGRKDSVRVDSQATHFDDFNQDTEGNRLPPEVQKAVGVLEVLGWTCIPPEAADDPTCAYCGKSFK